MYKLLSHTDLNGVGCGILAKLAFRDRIKILYNSIASLNREREWCLENEVAFPHPRLNVQKQVWMISNAEHAFKNAEVAAAISMEIAAGIVAYS